MKKLTLLIACTIIMSSAWSQGNFSLYHMRGTPQALNVNPAFMPKAKIYMSLPLGMMNVGVSNSAFSFNDLMTRRADDSLELNKTTLLKKLANLNVLSMDVQQEVIGVGFKVKESYFSFSVVNRLKFNFLYPGDLIKLGLLGNGEFLNQRVSMDGLGVNLSSYMEYNFGYARKIGELFEVGARLKLISGIANVNTRKSKLGLFTDPTTFALTLDGSAEINTSNVDQIFSDSTFKASSLTSSAFNFNNKGVGLDLGGTFQMNDKVTLTASAIDLGSISWKSNTKNFILKDFSYTFDGIDLNKYFADSSASVFKNLQDSLEKVFQREENTANYKTALGSKFYVGANYEFTKSLSAGALLFSQVIKGKFVPGLSLSGNATIKNWLVASVSYTMYNNVFTNLGLGISLRGGPVQFYFMTDNVLAFISPLSAKSFHLCGGISIWIKDKNKKDKKQAKDVKEGGNALPPAPIK